MSGVEGGKENEREALLLREAVEVCSAMEEGVIQAYVGLTEARAMDWCLYWHMDLAVRRARRKWKVSGIS